MGEKQAYSTSAIYKIDKVAPASSLGSGLATLWGPGPLQPHQGLAHALFRISKVHVREIHLKRLKHKQTAHLESLILSIVQNRMKCITELYYEIQVTFTSFSFLSGTGVCFLMLFPV